MYHIEIIIFEARTSHIECVCVCVFEFQKYPYKKGLLTQLVLCALFTAVIYFSFVFCSRHISDDAIDVYEIAFAIAHTTDNFNLLAFV